MEWEERWWESEEDWRNVVQIAGEIAERQRSKDNRTGNGKDNHQISKDEEGADKKRQIQNEREMILVLGKSNTLPSYGRLNAGQ